MTWPPPNELPEQRDAIVIDTVQRAHELDRRRDVLALFADVEQLARLSAAVAEVPVGEVQRGDVRPRRTARALASSRISRDRAEAVTKNDDGNGPASIGSIEPGAALVAVAVKADVSARD